MSLVFEMFCCWATCEPMARVKLSDGRFQTLKRRRFHFGEKQKTIVRQYHRVHLFVTCHNSLLLAFMAAKIRCKLSQLISNKDKQLPYQHGLLLLLMFIATKLCVQTLRNSNSNKPTAISI